jgi:hypothetical protein
MHEGATRKHYVFEDSTPSPTPPVDTNSATEEPDNYTANNWATVTKDLETTKKGEKLANYIMSVKRATGNMNSDLSEKYKKVKLILQQSKVLNNLMIKIENLTKNSNALDNNDYKMIGNLIPKEGTPEYKEYIDVMNKAISI